MVTLFPALSQVIIAIWEQQMSSIQPKGSCSVSVTRLMHTANLLHHLDEDFPNIFTGMTALKAPKRDKLSLEYKITSGVLDYVVSGNRKVRVKVNPSPDIVGK
jgi:hypothetical protein